MIMSGLNILHYYIDLINSHNNTEAKKTQLLPNKLFLLMITYWGCRNKNSVLVSSSIVNGTFSPCLRNGDLGDKQI